MASSLSCLARLSQIRRTASVGHRQGREPGVGGAPPRRPERSRDAPGSRTHGGPFCFLGIRERAEVGHRAAGRTAPRPVCAARGDTACCRRSTCRCPHIRRGRRRPLRSWAPSPRAGRSHPDAGHGGTPRTHAQETSGQPPKLFAHAATHGHEARHFQAKASVRSATQEGSSPRSGVAHSCGAGLLLRSREFPEVRRRAQAVVALGRLTNLTCLGTRLRFALAGNPRALICMSSS